MTLLLLALAFLLTTSWSGRKVTTARAYWRARLKAAGALPCYRCPYPVTLDQRWTVEHVEERTYGGNPTDPANQWVSHARCNYQAGGRIGAARTNARRAARTPAQRRSEGVPGVY